MRKTKPVHSGVEVQGRFAAPPGSAAKGAPLLQLRSATENRPKVGLSICGGRFGQQPVQHVNCRIRGDGACAPRLGKIRDEKSLAACLREGARDLLEAAAVPVGLDHCGAVRGRGARAQRAPVRRDSRKIDGENSAGFGFRGARCVRHPAIIGGSPAAINAARAAVPYRRDRRNASRLPRSATGSCR